MSIVKTHLRRKKRGRSVVHRHHRITRINRRIVDSYVCPNCGSFGEEGLCEVCKSASRRRLRGGS